MNYNEKGINGIGKRMFDIRTRRGISRQDIETKFGITYRILYNVEKGVSMPSLDVIVKFANEFDLSLEYLITGENKNG